MDATQAINFSDEESEEEREPGQKKAVAFLHILAQKDLSASKHPIYEGDNFIGRHDSNSIYMPYKALSKQHACIEVQGNSSLIYDMDSRNKTRRGKMFLKPNVRYELRDSDVIIFGDVKCQYIVQSEEDDDDDETGSETDSELMLQPPDSEDMDDKNSKEDENENESSFNLNDFLQPTQPCMPSPKLVFKTPRRLDKGKVFAADSDEDSPNDSPNKSNAGRFGDDSFIPETQLSAKKKNDFSVVEDSDSDTDIDETGPFDISALASVQTQAVMATQAVDNMETQAIDNMATLAVDNMATQAVDGMATQAVDDAETLAIDNIETQAIDNTATQAVDNMATQAVDTMETQAIDNMATLPVDNMATQAVDGMATQAVDNMETQAIDSMETQAIDNMATLAVDDMETQAIDNMETQAIDNTATIAVDNMATQAVDYSPQSDSSDTDFDEVRQSLLEAPTQAVGLDDSRKQGTPKECTRTLVLDSSTASSDVDESPVKQARSSRSIYDEPTQACDGIVSDSGSETDIEDRGIEAETQAVLGDNETEIDNMATVAVGQDDEEDTTEDKETMETNKIPITDKTGDVENMATVPIETDDDDTDLEDSDDKGANSVDPKMIDTVKIKDVEDMATVPIAKADNDDDDDTDLEDSDDKGVNSVDSKMIDTVKIKDVEDMATVPIAMADNDDDDDTDVEEGSKDEEEKSAINDTKLTDGNRDIIKEDEPIVAPLNSDHDDDNTEMEMNYSSQEYFLNYRTEQNPADKESPGPCEVEVTQPYEGPSDDTSTGDVLSSNHDNNDDVIDATQPYGGINEEETTEEPTSATSVTMELSSTQPYGAEGENKQPDSHDDGTEPTIPYGTKEDIAMETGDSEIESTQAYGMQSSETQVPDSQDGDDQPTTSSRFPDFKTLSPSKPCLKQPNTPERKATKARRVTFEPADNEEEGQESEAESEPLKRGSRSRGRSKDNKSLVEGEGQSTSSGARRSGSRVSQRNKDEKVDTETKDDVNSGRRSTRFKAVSDEAAAKPGRKRKVGALEPVSADSSAPTTKDKSDAKRGKKQRGGKVEEDPNGDPVSVDKGLTMTDAKPTRKKEFDAENPRPSLRQGSRVKDERKLSESSISSVGSEGSTAGRVLKTIVQMGKKLTRMSKREKKSSERTAEVVDDGESDDTASISSTASSVRDFAEVEPSTRPTRGTKNQKVSKKITEEHAGHSTPGARRSQRGGTEKEEMTDSQDSEKKAGSRTRRGGVAMETVETEVDGQSSQSRSRTRRNERAIIGDETTSQADSQGEVSTRRGKSEKIHSQNDEEVSSKRTRRGTTQGVKPDVQEVEPNKSIKKGEILSKMVKPSTRGKTITQSSGDDEQGIHVETSVQEDKESHETSSRRNRRATSESQEVPAKQTGETNVRHSGRRRTIPARFLNSDGKDKATESHRSSSEQEAEDTSSSNACVFAVPKALGKPSRKMQQKELPSSSQKEVESETVQFNSRGRRSAAKIPEAAVEKEKLEPVKEALRVSRKRGQEVPATMSDTVCLEESKAEENITPPNRRRGRATTKISEASSEDGKSKDLKEDSRDSSKRGRGKPVEEPASEKSMVTATTRGSRAAVSAPTAKTSKELKERDDRTTEGDKCIEVVKTRGKRGATATSSPSSASAAKKSRQATTIPISSQSSPSSSSSPGARTPRRSCHQTDQTPTVSPSLRRRLSDVRPKVMFTGVMDGSWQKTVTTLGGDLVDSVHECTHLITDKVRRTVKFLCCMARGVIIITPTWLEESKTAKMFIDPGPFQLKDKGSERQHGFKLQMSLQKASQVRLLTGYKIHVTPGVKPEPQQMKDIITCAGGQYVAKLPTKSVQQMVVVSCDGDKSLWAGLSKAGIHVVSSEFILTGILRQDILLKDYKLK